MSYLGQLGTQDQLRVAEMARSLAASSKRGTPGKELLKIVGSISHDDLLDMQRAIEEDCEKIDADEW